MLDDRRRGEVLGLRKSTCHDELHDLADAKTGASLRALSEAACAVTWGRRCCDGGEEAVCRVGCDEIKVSERLETLKPSLRVVVRPNH